MGLAPLPHTPGVVRVPEVIAIGRLAQPTPLAGRLAGLVAGALAAVTLAPVVTIIGEEELAATTALTPLRFRTHRGSNHHDTQQKPLKTDQGRRDSGRRRKKSF